MPLYCSRETFESLSGLPFPADKDQVLSYIKTHGAPEAVIVALNQLSDGVVYGDISAVCEHVSIACSLEVRRALEDMAFPAGKQEIMNIARRRGVSQAALNALDDLADGYTYASIDEVCGSVSTFESGS
ncbi:MAG: DUF2795 domain-containing protein [Dehalococcoidia bacterium]